MAGSSLTQQDERILSAVSHLSVIVPFMGVAVPVVIWATQKGKSAYVCIQALQAAVYQLVLFILTILGAMCYAGALTVAAVAAFSGTISVPLTTTITNDPDSIAVGIADLLSALPSFVPFVLFGFFVLFIISAVLYGIAAGFQTSKGIDFRYIIVGKRVERYLLQD